MRRLMTSLVAGALISAGAIAAHAQSITVEPPPSVETQNLPRQPNVFRDCFEPLPSYCVRPPGLLWFGSFDTLSREQAYRRRPVHSDNSQ